MDGIDVALLETDGERALVHGPSLGIAYDDAFRTRLASAMETAKSIGSRAERPGDLAALEAEITDRHAEAIRAFLSRFSIGKNSIDLVGFHGQTVLHRPERGLTVQLGDGKRLADALGVPVVHDMRAADMAAGGEGAPLAPAYHVALAANLKEELAASGPVVFVNIGGISNVTYVGAGDPIACDTGPGNNLLDQWVLRETGRSFDDGGRIAASGKIIDGLAKSYLASPFISRPAPKSLDRADFQPPAAGSGTTADVARTLCSVTARSILMARSLFPEEPKLWVICGGGRHHPLIMADLTEGAAVFGARVVPAEASGLSGDAIEAEAWAYLAVRSARGLPLTWPTTTGCRAPTSGGVLNRP
ncbi:anhydro-N-acetylmuramic acid kinase [Consotaella salsifontis]|uniref:Anhydro-N-acetylmuramic acid kinase n=2 Tax=Consotaella salsifontis TaxID=1365950 RepID=A0A1T4LR86_9HYPH|nr:anhydro-N-acetylmuramic acid kinase [Consotaella salsifontis]